MAIRRKPYTKVLRHNQVRPEHVKGMGDVVFKGFQCLNPACTEFIFVRKSRLKDQFKITCPQCGYVMESGGTVKIFDYDLIDLRDNKTIDQGPFEISHTDYVNEAQEYKYCILCCTLKPLDWFSKHKSRASGHQGECRLCKDVYNDIKNPTRLTDQHHEASRQRRIYNILSGVGKMDSHAVFERYDGHCFKCGKQLTYKARGKKDYHLDHTLPNRLLWPITTDNATLLCSKCNNEKHDKWPSEVYEPEQLRRLAIRTGYPYELLSGEPKLNEEAVQDLVATVDQFLEQWIAYPDMIRKLRNLIIDMRGIDIYDQAKHVPPHLR